MSTLKCVMWHPWVIFRLIAGLLATIDCRNGAPAATADQLRLL